MNTGFGGPGGGEGSLGGDGGPGLEDEFRFGSSVFVLRAGGGAGGGPRFELPVVWGLMVRAVGGAFGGGGGGALALLASFSAWAFSSCFFCSIYSLMKSAFSSI